VANLGWPDIAMPDTKDTKTFRRVRLLVCAALTLLVHGLSSAFSQDWPVRTEYKAIVLHYNPHIRVGEEFPTVQQVYGYRDVDQLCRDYIKFLRRASGGQVNFSIAQKFDLDEFPPDNDPDVDFTAENYYELRGQGYDMWNHGLANYVAICNDPRFQIVPRVAAGEVDAIWVFAPVGCGFWETAMAGHGAYWVNGGAYPEVNCARKFVIYGFGWESHQGVGFMLENTGHMCEVIMHDRISAGWPRSREFTGWNTLNLNNPGRAPTLQRLHDWDYFTTSDAVHWHNRLVAPGQSQAGLSHFPPTACVNYGWSAVRISFDYSWDLDSFQTYGGNWGLGEGLFSVTAGPGHKAILHGSHDLEDNLGKYRVPVILTDVDIETGITVESPLPGAHAGLLLRCSQYETGTDRVKGYYVGLNPDQDRLELARLDNSYTLLAQAPMTVDAGVLYPLYVSLRGPVLQVSLSPSSAPVLTFKNLDAKDGAVGFANYNTDASFSHLYVTPVVTNYAETWRTYPDLGTNSRVLNPLEWSGDDQPYNDMDYWYAWWYEHLPKNPGTHEVTDPATGQILGRVLNSWWPYLFDINRFSTPFLPRVNVISAPADTTAPLAPANLRGIALGTSSIRVIWEEPPDDIGVTRYEIYRDGQFLRETPMPRFSDSGLAANTSYSYAVKARDGSGNTSDLSTTLAITTLLSDDGLQNPGFEFGFDLPVPWKPDAFKNTAIFTWEEAGAGRNGSRCISIDAGFDLNDARWIQEVTALVPNGRYLLSGWLKGQGIVLDQGATVGANLCAFGTWDHSAQALTGTFDWTRVEVNVFANSEGKLTVGCRLGFWGNLAGGKVWFDDLALDYIPPFKLPVAAWGSSAFNLTNLPAGLTNAIAMAVGDAHALALKSDGSVIAWGNNSEGQASVPAGLGQVISIAAGGSHSLAVKADGTIVAWGNNMNGQTVVPQDLTNVLAAAAGGRFSVALREDGTVVAWGGNDWGETNVPPGLTNAVAIDAGLEFSLALKSDGTVTAWGTFMGTDDDPWLARVPEGLSNVVAIACGLSHAAALRCDGTVAAWGDSPHGETNVPSGLRQVIAIAAAGDHTLALKADGSVTGWGGNLLGELTVPVAVTNAWGIECGSYSGFALLGDKPPTISVRPGALAYQPGEFRVDFTSRRGQPYFFLRKPFLTPDAEWNIMNGLIAKDHLGILSDTAPALTQGFYTIRTCPYLP
jgi:hypothetical protein